MGVDFIKKCAKGFKKSWDRAKLDLAAPNLFKHDLQLAPRTYCASLSPGTDSPPGREFLLRMEGSDLRLYDGTSPVGSIKGTPISLVAAVKSDGCGVAVARVVRVHEFSGAVDVSVA